MEQNGESQLTKLTVHAVVPDPNTEAQVVILHDEQRTQVLPIWVGVAEGNAIRLALTETPTPRPMTHDLLRNMLEHLNLTVSKVVVEDVKRNTYFARVHLIAQGIERSVDARPSDAIALALRTNSPIFATASVLRQRGSGSLEAVLAKLNTKPTITDE
jgi:bifunctional DNase/RNase